jgi:phosphodiester glycosidase
MVAFAAVLVPSAASATPLVPGVDYSRQVIRTSAGRVVLHVVIAPKPGGLYALRPVLSNGKVTGRERVSSMQRRLSRGATLAGVNADLFNVTTGHPSGIFLRGNVLASRPERTRSTLGIDVDGLLRVGLINYWGFYKVGDLPAHPVFQLNRPLTQRGLALYTSLYGSRTPYVARAREVILTRIPSIRPGVRVQAVVSAVVSGGGHRIPPGGAVLQARGFWRAVLVREARPGRVLVFRANLTSWWDNVRNAIGGGPVLVRNGVAVYQSGEGFTSDQLLGRHPRTAVGQLADGRILMLVADGRSSRSVGLTTRQLANQMVRLGAVTAMQFDSGGSSTIAFDGGVLNTPSDGSERSISDSLMVFYYGVFARKPRFATFSPNGDGVADLQRLRAKFVRPTQAHIELVRPDGAIRWQYNGSVSPRTIRKDLSSRLLMEGRWRWIVSGVDSRGYSSRMERSFAVNNTLGFLTFSKGIMYPSPDRGGRLRIGFRLKHAADVSVTIRTRSGRIVRVLVPRQNLKPGGYAVIWNARNASGDVVRSGRYFVRVRAINDIGRVMLAKPVVVRRAAA